VNSELLGLLEKIATFGDENDARETAVAKRMLNITPETGRLLWILARAMNAKRIVEVGTSNAYSTIWLADAARATGGRVTTLEMNPEKIALARANLRKAGLDDVVVEIIEGTAAASLAALPGPFDLVFLDADKASYLQYLELALPKMRTGAMLIADNATTHAEELKEFTRRVRSHPQLFAVTVPIGNGEEIALKV
jgi:predicted O-methyltransferase YrrM